MFGIALAACGSGSDTGGRESGVGLGDGPLYVTTLELASVSATGENGLTNLITADSVAAGSEWSPRLGTELATWNFPFGFDRHPSVWLNDGAGTVDRWDLSENGSLEPPTLDTTLSTVGLGMIDSNFIWWGALLSPDLAIGPNYSVTGQELIRWNPTRMEIIGTLPLGLPEQAYTYGRIRARPDGTLLAGYSCSTYDDNERLERACTGMLILSADGTEVIARDEWEGCAAWVANQGWSSPDGTEWFGDGWTALGEEGETLGSCWLRVLPGATEFDRSFGASQPFQGSEYVRGGFFPFGDRALFRYYPEALNPEREAGELEAFQWSTWDYESERPEPLPGFNEWRGTGQDPIRVDGRLFFQELSGWNAYNACEDAACWERERQALDVAPFYEITESGVLPAFSVTGGATLLTIVRVR